MAATIKDIAKRLNISVSTVSYALNGGPRQVPDAVRDRVMEVARELEYRPNRIARSLATGRTHAIGVVPTEPIRDLAGMNYFHAVFNGVVNAAEDMDQDVMLFTRADASRAEAIDTLLDGRVDGLLLLSPRLPSTTVTKLVDAGIPFALISTAAPEGHLSFGSDNASGMRMALEHLVSLGHRRIGHIAGSLDMHDGFVRWETFRSAVSALDLPLNEDWICSGGFTTKGGAEAAKHILSQRERPTALICGNDESAYGAIQYASEHGLCVPEELSFVGFDDAMFAQYLTPSLTTVAQPFDAIGADALRAVVELIEGRKTESKIYPPRLIVRSSTTAPPRNP